MRPKSTHRHRICGTPVRTGCITCKIRRVKCGEEKPHCKRCTSTGRKCDGYATPEKATKPKSPSQREVHGSVSPTQPDEPVEQRILSFYTTFTAPRLSGNFSSNFWERRVMHATTEPCVRHAVIAIGAVHQNFVSRHESRGKEDLSTEAFAFRQHTKAISYLHQLMSTRTQRLDITLIACILFICFDCLVGNHTSAIIHLKAGLKILQDIKLQNAHGATFAQTTSAREWEREFSPLLLALGVQAASYVNPGLQEDRSALWAALKRAGIPTHPTTFTSLDEARHALDTLAAEVMADRTSTTDRITANKIPNPKGPEGQRHVAALQRWEEALGRSLPEIVKRDTLVTKTQVGASMLKLHGTFLSIVIGFPEPADEKFHKLLGLCETILRTKSGCACGPSQLNFSIDLGLIGPLFFAALRARQKSVQRQAYDMLLQAPGREGMWDSEDALRVAAEAVGIEGCQGPCGKLSLPRSCPEHEARTWDSIADKAHTLPSRPYGQKEEPLLAPAFIRDLPLTRSITSGSGLPFTKEEYEAAITGSSLKGGSRTFA